MEGKINELSKQEISERKAYSPGDRKIFGFMVQYLDDLHEDIKNKNYEDIEENLESIRGRINDLIDRDADKSLTMILSRIRAGLQKEKSGSAEFLESIKEAEQMKKKLLPLLR
jgi:hypothetical protein